MKKTIIIVLSIVILLAVLVVPLPSNPYKDGTTVYTALTYRIINWKKYSDSYKPYENTSVYFIPDNFASIDTLWQKEMDSWDGDWYGDVSFTAIITDTWGNGDIFLIKDESKPGDIGDTTLSNYDKPKIIKNGKVTSFSELKVGDRIKITCDGMILESYPAQLGKVYEIEIL